MRLTLVTDEGVVLETWDVAYGSRTRPDQYNLAKSIALQALAQEIADEARKAVKANGDKPV